MMTTTSMCRRGLLVVLVLVAAVLPLTAPAATARRAPAETRRQAKPSPATTVQAYPSPGTTAAMPATGITFRGLDPSAARSVQVAGSTSGPHAVVFGPQHDGQGVTLQPRVAFTPGENVTVSGLAVAGGDGDHFSFTIARPAPDHRFEQLQKDGLVTPAGGTAAPSSGTSKSVRAASGPPYRTRPDLNPPKIVPSTPASGVAPGVLLTTPILASGGGAELMGNNGEPYWYKPVPAALAVGDLEKVQYQGKDALVWFEGLAPYGPGSYRGSWTMVDTAYKRIATIKAANGMQADIHDIEVTPSGNAYLDIYNPVTLDLSSVGGSKTANVLEFVIQEVNIASGDLLFEWHSLPSFPVTDSYELLTNDPVDYMHGNSVSLDTDGNLLVSARHLSVGFKINRTTGQVMWRLGGKRNQFTFAPAGEKGPAYNHHFVRVAPGVLSFFDNERNNPSRGVQYQVHETAPFTATRIKQQFHTPNVEAFSQGSYQQLPGGHSFIAWGNTAFITEYDAAGGVHFEASVPNSYRTFREVWHGRPTSRPAIAAAQGSGHDTVYVSWNGATDVTKWEVLAGQSRDSLTTAVTANRDGFETAIDFPHSGYVQVRGRAADNSVLGTSLILPTGSWFSEHDDQFVRTAYHDFLGRGPTAPELELAVRQLQAGATRTTVLATLANSDEWLGGIVIRWYLDTLGRNPDRAGYRYWVSALRNRTVTVAKGRALFYSSPEYFTHIGHGDLTIWVNDLFVKLLARHADRPGLTFWVAQARAHGRGPVAYALHQSTESGQLRVRALYATVLQRAPEPAALAYWTLRLVANGDISVAVNLAASTEYYTKAQLRSP